MQPPYIKDTELASIEMVFVQIELSPRNESTSVSTQISWLVMGYRALITSYTQLFEFIFFAYSIFW